MVHAVHAGITQLLMLATWLTKLYVVDYSPLRRAFCFSMVDYFTQLLFLGGSDCDGGGNRYQGFLLSFNFDLRSFAWFNLVKTK